MTGPTSTRGIRQGGLKHAYGGVQQWAVEVVLMRMGVPEEYVEYQTKLAALTRTAVITVTPFGVTKKFRRASELPCIHVGRYTQLCTVEWLH